MTLDNTCNQFGELPEGLEDEMLTNSKGASKHIPLKFKEIRDKKNFYRKELVSDGECTNFKEIETVKNFPT